MVATNALELGVDIGSLDAVVMLGYPGSSASLWQQVGRAGRGTRPAAAIMVAYNSPVDQFFASHPNALLQRPPEVQCSTHLAPFGQLATFMPVATKWKTNFAHHGPPSFVESESRAERGYKGDRSLPRSLIWHGFWPWT